MVMQMNSDFLRGKDNVDEDHKRGNMCEIFLRLQEISSSVKCLTILVLLYKCNIRGSLVTNEEEP